tara:strand:+ start:306 stop:473 length:168 start_codon:yes stop_codon:yes gene_type:complete
MPGKSKKQLTPRQQATMKRHSKHHTSKHMAMMKKAMLAGKTFGQAHKMAQKKVGT